MITKGEYNFLKLFVQVISWNIIICKVYVQYMLPQFHIRNPKQLEWEWNSYRRALSLSQEEGLRFESWMSQEGLSCGVCMFFLVLLWNPNSCMTSELKVILPSAWQPGISQSVVFFFILFSKAYSFCHFILFSSIAMVINCFIYYT